MKIFGVVGHNTQTIDLSSDPETPDGHIEMKEPRPTQNHIANEDGDWVIHEEGIIQQALNKQTELMTEASNKIELLKIRIKHADHDDSQDDTPEKRSLTAWERYYIALDDITEQPNFPYEIEWPQMPE